MPITSTCSGCGKTLAVADEYAGRQARCPECGTIYTVPTPASIPTLTPTDDAPSINAPIAPLDLGSPTFPAQPAAPLSTNAASASRESDPFADPVPAPSAAKKYWMRATNGAEYGPADSQTLARWFSEGRVGQNYQIREGENGNWQPATYFQPGSAAVATPVAPASANPYAAQHTLGARTGLRRYPKSDQSGLVLAMGILAWLGLCPIFGIIGWVVGAQAISDMRNEQADPANMTVTQIGYYLSMVNIIVTIACAGMFFLFVALAAITNP